MNKNNVRFLTEGYADELLLTILEVHPRFIERVGAIQKFNNIMNRQLKFFHKTIVGIVDYDKGKSLTYFKNFELCAEPDNIMLMQRPNSNQYVIFLKPKAIEKWILDASKSIELKPEDYNLSSDIKIFRKHTKNINASKNNKLIEFIREIKKKEAAPFIYLQEILQNLLNKKEYPCKTN